MLTMSHHLVIVHLSLIVLFGLADCSRIEIDHPRGILTLDHYTFDKVISKFHYSLIKFDHVYPIGLDHEAFAALGRQLAQTDSDILIANLEIGPQTDEEALARRYSVPYDDFPALRLFVNHDFRNITVPEVRKLKPVVYPTERDYNVNSGIVLNPITMRLFLWTQINVRTPLPNCTDALDALAEEFVYLFEQGEMSKLDTLQSSVDQIYTRTSGWEKTSAGIYAKLMKKARDQGLPFFDYEHRRIRKLLADNFGVKEEKKRQLRVAFNILQSFRLRHYESMLKENENARIRDLNPGRIEL